MHAPQTYTGPGLVDLQLNGFAGFDFNGDPSVWSYEDFGGVAAALQQHGIVSALPTLITDDPGRLIARVSAYCNLVQHHADLLDVFPGLHIEGPFISREDGPRGAHPLAYCTTPADQSDLIRKLWDVSQGRIKIVTLAPELDGALSLIEECVSMGIQVAIGHTMADRKTLDAAADAGASLSTHLGNGSHQMMPRLDNYVQLQLADDRLLATFIADGHHIPYPTLKNFIRAKTPTRTILVSDAIAAAACGPGKYQLGGQTVVVDQSLRCQISGQDNLAGSALTLDRAVLNVARHCDVTFEAAWVMASKAPAAFIGLEPKEVQVQILESGFRLLDE